MSSRFLPSSLGLNLFLLPAAVLQPLSALDFDSAGFRFGLDDEKDDNFTGYEAYGTLAPVYSLDLGKDSMLSILPEGAVGIIRGNDDTAGYLRLGAAARISLGELPLSLSINTGIQVLTEDTFGDFDLGGNFNFSSGIGFDWKFNQHWEIGYRFQHTSNANLYETNPGLDLHSFNFAYKF
ncbi:MAG: acyloxyacyl hydrolase [Verrucomicrobiota bacterium]